MSEPLELARRLFGFFQQSYETSLHQAGIPYLQLAGNEAALGFSVEEIRVAINVLNQKGLIKPMGIGRWTLTDRGRETCLHPNLVGSRLGPPQAISPIVHSSTVNVHGGHVQVGHHNTQNITYRAVLQAALDTVEERDDVPAAVAGALRKLVEFPDLEALLSDAERKARGT